MSTNFPTSLDSYTNPTGGDLVSSQVGNRTHSQFHSDNNDAIEALETKVGANGSANTDSHDYKLSGVIGSDKAVSKTGTETLTNKTLTAPNIANPVLTGVDIADNQFTISDNSDNTKKTVFQASGISTGTTRTLTLPNANTEIVGNDATQTLTNKTINASNNTISNLTTGMFAANVVDTDGALSANSDTRIPSQKAVKTYADAVAAGNGLITQFTSDLTITTQNSDTNVISATIPGGTLSTGYMVKGKAYIRTCSGSASNLIVKLKYGSTTVATATLNNFVGVTTGSAGYIDFSLYATGATNTQYGKIHISKQYVGDTPVSTFPLVAVARGTSSEDSTTPLTLSLTATWSGASSSVTFDAGYMTK